MSLVPRWNNRHPSLFGKKAADFFNLGSLFEDIEHEFSALGYSPGLSVSSDEKKVYVEADMPGLTAKEVDVSIDSEGVLWIKGERKAEDKTKKYYRKAHQLFSYCVQLTDDVDTTIEPQASCKNGVMTITFQKKKEKQTEAKKIQVKEEK